MVSKSYLDLVQTGCLVLTGIVSIVALCDTHRDSELQLTLTRPWVGAGPNPCMELSSGNCHPINIKTVIESSDDAMIRYPLYAQLDFENVGHSPATDLVLRGHWCLHDTPPDSVEQCRSLEQRDFPVQPPSGGASTEDRNVGLWFPAQGGTTYRYFSKENVQLMRSAMRTNQKLYIIEQAEYSFASQHYRTTYLLEYAPHADAPLRATKPNLAEKLVRGRWVPDY